MSRFRKLLRLRILISSMIILFFLLIFTTTTGLKTAIGITNWFLPGKISTTNLHGALSRTIKADQIVYQDPSLLITANQVNISLSAWKLLSGHLTVHHLNASNLDIKQTHPFPPSESTQLSWPHRITIEKVQLPQLNYYSLDGNRALQGELIMSGAKDDIQLNFVSQLPVVTKITGTYKPGSESPLNLTATWETLPKLTLQEVYQFTNGQLHVEGDVENWRADLQTHVHSPLIKDSVLQIKAHQINKNLTVDQSTWQLPEGKLALAGTLNTQQQWQAVLTATDLNPGQFSKNVAGKIHFNLQGQGQHFHLHGIQQIQLSDFAGTWRDLPISAKGTFVQRSPDDWQIQQVDFVLADNQCHVQGGYRNQWDLKWQCQMNHLNALRKDLRGDLFTKGELTGVDANATVNGELSSSQFHFQQFDLEKLQAKIQGQLSKHQLQATWSSFNKPNLINVTGGWENHLWRGDVNQVMIGTAIQQWILERKASVEIGEKAKQSSPLCFKNQKQRACLVMQADPKNWMGQLSLDQVQLKPWLVFFAVPVEASSIANVRLNLHGNQQSVLGDLDATLSASPLIIHNKINTYPAQLQSAHIKATLNKNGLKTDIQAVANQHDNIDAQIQMAQFKYPLQTSMLDQPLSGEAQVTLNDVSWISGWIKQLANIQGRIVGHMQFAGTVARPKVSGNADLEKFSSDLPDLGLHLQNGQLHATPSNNGVLISGSVQSGDGTLNIRGTIPSLIGNTAYRLNLTGNNIVITNTKNYKIWANADMQFNLDDQGFALTGLLTIPKANVSPDDFSNTVEMPPDVKFTDEKNKQSVALPFSTDFKLQLGDAVNINTHGLTGLLKGNLHIVSPANQPTTSATGILTVDKGFYNAYGQQLTLEKSELLYNGGDILNPGMSIQAYRSVRAQQGSAPADKPFANLFSGADVLGFNQEMIRVGVKVTGTAQQPKIDLYSQPPGLNSSDILSYLIFSHPLVDVSRENASALLGAVGTMAFSGNNSAGGVYRDMQKRLGLDEFSLTTLPNNLQQKNENGFAPSNAAVAIGKTLSPKLHVQYIQGITSPIGVIQLQYMLNKRVTLQAESSPRTRALDILFTREK